MPTNADMNSLGVGIVGYGLAGSVFHAPLVSCTPGLQVAAIVTADPERRAKAQATYPGATLFANVDAMLDSAAVDVVVVASPNRFHVTVARAALDAGCVVVVDKPLAVTAEQGQDLADHAAHVGGLLTVFQNRRWDGDFLTLRRIVDDGRLGTVGRLESRFERWRATPSTGWREEPDPADGGGVLLDLGAHLVDQALVLLGPVQDVYAEIDLRRPGAKVNDDAFLALRHTSGARSHLWASSTTPSPGPRFRVLGDRAGWTKHGLDPQEATLRAGGRPGDPEFGEEPASAWGFIEADGATEQVPTLPGDYVGFYRALVAACQGAGPPPVDVRDSITGLAVLDAAERSARTGSVVELSARSDD